LSLYKSFLRAAETKPGVKANVQSEFRYWKEVILKILFSTQSGFCLIAKLVGSE
jgi:hypothetical protein